MMTPSPQCIRVAIVSTGTEILQGLYADTNAQYLSDQLTGMGYSVRAIAAAPDYEDEIVATLRSLLSRADLIITTGALGPTEDDNLREAVERVWEAPLEFDQHAFNMIEERLRGRYRVIPESNRKQTMLPRGCTPIYNAYGTAPGFALKGDGKKPAIISLPGPPREMKPLFRELVVPWLKENLSPSLCQIVLQAHTAGRGEGELNERLKDLFGAREDVTVGLLASGGLVRVRMTLRGPSQEDVLRLRGEMVQAIYDRIGEEDIWGFDNDTLEEVVGRMLLQKGWSIAVAESCTGGLINAALTRIPGASAYVKTGYIAYSNETKMRLLGVREETLRQHGAVSAETAVEMAEGALRESRADIAASITGIAGPTGGTPEKPVGLIYIGIASRDRETETHRMQYPGERDLIRHFSSVRALDLIRRRLK